MEIMLHLTMSKLNSVKELWTAEMNIFSEPEMCEETKLALLVARMIKLSCTCPLKHTTQLKYLPCLQPIFLEGVGIEEWVVELANPSFSFSSNCCSEQIKYKKKNSGCLKISQRMMFPDTKKEQKEQFHIPGRTSVRKIIKSPCKCSV